MYKKHRLFTWQGILILCLPIAFALILQSCFGTSKNRSGKLSEAMEESSDEHKGERKVDTEPDPDYESEDEDDEYGYELGTETISSDGLSGFEMYTGLGLNLVQTDGFQLGGELLPGMIIWGGETSEGFDNDVFGTFYYTKLKFFLRFGW